LWASPNRSPAGKSGQGTGKARKTVPPSILQKDAGRNQTRFRGGLRRQQPPLEILKECAPRHIAVIYENRYASHYKDSVARPIRARKYNVKVMGNYQMAWCSANHIAAPGSEKASSIGRPGGCEESLGTVDPAQRATEKYFFDWLTGPVKERRPASWWIRSTTLWGRLCTWGVRKLYRKAVHLRPRDFSQSGRLSHAGAEVQTGNSNVFEGTGSAA